jgi:hypothetical protein
LIEEQEKKKAAELINEGIKRESAQVARGYYSDERSGDEVSDSEQEFERIVELDSLIKSFQETTMEVQELHAKIVDFFSKLRALDDLIDFDSPDIKEIVTGMVARELIYFTSISQVVKLAEQAYLV